MIQKEMQRTDSFDILKGIGIILMIIAHTFGPNSILWDYIYAFHMPLFFIVSGYFYKTKPFFELSKKNINKLLIPYIVLCIIVIILNQIRQTHEITDDIKVALNGIGPGWFLLAMFMARFEFYFILKIYSKNYLLVSIITSTAVCLFCYYYNMPRFSTLLSFFPSLASLVFIATGYFIRQHNLLSINKGGISFVVLGGVLWFITSVFGKVDLSICMFKLSIIDFLGSIGGTYIFYIISKIIEKHNNWLKTSLLYAGKYSLVLLFFHSIDYCFPIWHHITPYLNPSFHIITILIIRLIYVTVCLFITLKIKWLRSFFNINN